MWLSILIGLLIESHEVLLSVVDGILSYDHRLSGLDRMLLPTAREVRDCFHPEVLATEVFLTSKGTLIRRIECCGAKCQTIQILDAGCRIINRDVLIVFVPRFRRRQIPLSREALYGDVTDIEDLFDDQVIDRRA